MINADNFDVDIINFPFLDRDIPRAPSYGVSIYLNLFGLLECLVMLLTLTLENKF